MVPNTLFLPNEKFLFLYCEIMNNKRNPPNPFQLSDKYHSIHNNPTVTVKWW